MPAQMVGPRHKATSRRFVYTHADVLIADDADLVILRTPLRLGKNGVKPKCKGNHGKIRLLLSTFLWLCQTLWQGFLLLVKAWNIALALSDLSGLACSSAHDVPLPDLNHCKPILPHQTWTSFKALESQVISYGRELKELLALMSQVNDHLGLNIDTARDLTLYGAEAHVLSELTSGSQPQTGGWFRKATADRAWDQQSYLNIFEDPPALGHCWRFPGSTGHVAIQLDKPSNISAISVGYPLRQQLSDAMMLEAPRLLRIWGIPNEDVDVHCLSSTSRQRPLSTFSRKSGSAKRRPSAQRIAYQVTEFQYDIHRQRLRQRFPVRRTVCPAVPFLIIVVEVIDNWGADETCVYRVGVHGNVAD